jgi:hypothetical protein
MHKTKIINIIATVALAAGVLVSGFTASAASIFMNPSSQFVADGASFSVDIMATGLPEGTFGGAIDISWVAGDMTLDSVYLATVDPADSNGGLFMGPWDPTSTFFTGIDSTGPGSISGLYIGTFLGVTGDAPIARLNFILGTGVSHSQITMAAAAVGGTWSAWDGINPPYEFTNDYTGATVNPIPNGDVNGDSLVDIVDLLLALKILNGQYTPTQAEQNRWDVAPLVGGVPQPDGQNTLGDYVVLHRKVLGQIN